MPDTPEESLIPYTRFVEDAMRGVMRRAMADAAENGLPGNHHFYIAFRTGADGVDIPSGLRAQYPDEMTIVIQHQFWNFEVHEEAFSVELSFGGRKTPLYVPFSAVTSFADPDAQFGLQFREGGEEPPEGAMAPRPAGETPPAEDADDEGGDDDTPSGEKVVRIDSFRKK